jgi:predicted DsbA family dithiol-disulfide isomerase
MSGTRGDTRPERRVSAARLGEFRLSDGERLGKTMKLPPVQPRSRLAHEAAHWAREQGRFDDYYAAVFRCFFERGEGRVEVLTSLAAS